VRTGLLDPFEHDLAGVGVILEVVAVNEFDFERREGSERCGQAKVIAAARALSPKTPRKLSSSLKRLRRLAATFFERRQTLARSA
jgi:hypothetical protein